jgi:hypothetical protein
MKPKRIPLSLKIAYTLMVAAIVPAYWVGYGPVNFLWSSDIALLVTVVALWREQRLLASTMALAALLPDSVWTLDYLLHLAAGRDLLGFNATGYMFDAERPLWLRALSLFHVVLPPVLAFLVWRLGYDRRALPAATLLAWAVLPLSYWVSDVERNINWVHGLGADRITLLPGGWHVLALMVLLPLLVYLPTHLLLARLCRRGR